MLHQQTLSISSWCTDSQQSSFGFLLNIFDYQEWKHDKMCIFVLISEDVLHSFYFISYLVVSCITVLVTGLENQHLHGIPVIHFASVNSLTAPSPAYLYLLSASTLSFSLRLSWSDFVCLCLFNLSHTTAHLIKKREKKNPL